MLLLQYTKIALDDAWQILNDELDDRVWSPVDLQPLRQCKSLDIGLDLQRCFPRANRFLGRPHGRREQHVWLDLRHDLLDAFWFWCWRRFVSIS